MKNNKINKVEINNILKLKEIDQLDSAILQFSKNTLATKQLCATVLVAILAIILKITANKLDYAIYVGSLITVIVFWIIDSNSYYYQRKLRIRMTGLVNNLIPETIISDGYGMPIIKSETNAWKSAFFNHSQYFYLLLTIVIVTIAIFQCFGWI